MGYTSAISRALSRLYLACVSLTRVRRPTPKEDSRKADLESDVAPSVFLFQPTPKEDSREGRARLAAARATARTRSPGCRRRRG